ncbi:MAG: DUF5074 domain-containing protein [Cytophagaceae bacterium]|nr:DUF5074 domain-containing protein [Cytophagaceae bacterium]
MKTGYFIRQSSILAAFSATLFACDPSNEAPQPYERGVLVLNSGNFFDNNGSISLLTRTSDTASTNIFQRVNNRPLTGGAQGYAEVEDKGLILVDNSSAGLDKVEIVDARTFKSLATLAAPDIENPRAVVKVGAGKAYVTCWGTVGQFPNFFVNPGYIAVVDLTQNRITKKIPLQKGVEGLALVGNEVFITGQGDENLLQVVDSQTDAVRIFMTGAGSATKSGIDLGGNAGTLTLDANNKLWTLVGREAVRINPQTKTIEARLPVGTDPRRSPGNLTLSGDRRTLFFTYTFYDAADNYKQKGELYAFGINDTSIPTTKPVARKVFSGLGFDAESNLLYAGFTPSFKQAGYVFRYQSDGKLVDSVKVEVGPSGFYFK